MLVVWARILLLSVLATVGISCSAQTKPLSPPEKGITKQASGVGTGNAADSNSEKSASPNVTVNVNQETAPSHKSNESQNGEDIQIQRKIADFTAWLVVVGFVQAVVFAFTLFQINRQAGIMEEHRKSLEDLASAANNNAAAAKASSEALVRQGNLIEAQTQVLIKAQRAWVVVDDIGAPPTIYEDGLDRPVELSFFAPTPFLVFNLKTTGATIATLIGTGARFHLVPSLSDIPEPALPDQPIYKIGTGILPQAGLVKAPNEVFKIGLILEGGALSRDQFVSVKEKKSFLCAYGFVAYRDSFEEPRETRFCYVYRISEQIAISQETGKNIFPSEFRLGGPEAYNRYT